MGRRKWYVSSISRQQPSIWLFDWREDLPADLALLADVRTLTNEGDHSGAAREFRIEDLRMGEVWVRGHRLVGFDEFMTSARDAC
jgi:hypothetical protein